METGKKGEWRREAKETRENGGMEEWRNGRREEDTKENGDKGEGRREDAHLI